MPRRSSFTPAELRQVREHYVYRLKALRVDLENLVTRGALQPADARPLLQDIEDSLRKGRWLPRPGAMS